MLLVTVWHMCLCRLWSALNPLTPTCGVMNQLIYDCGPALLVFSYLVFMAHITTHNPLCTPGLAQDTCNVKYIQYAQRCVVCYIMLY